MPSQFMDWFRVCCIVAIVLALILNTQIDPGGAQLLLVILAVLLLA
jgi:hypothetical protein